MSLWPSRPSLCINLQLLHRIVSDVHPRPLDSLRHQDFLKLTSQFHRADLASSRTGPQANTFIAPVPSSRAPFWWEASVCPHFSQLVIPQTSSTMVPTPGVSNGAQESVPIVHDELSRPQAAPSGFLGYKAADTEVSLAWRDGPCAGRDMLGQQGSCLCFSHLPCDLKVGFPSE